MKRSVRKGATGIDATLGPQLMKHCCLKESTAVPPFLLAGIKAEWGVVVGCKYEEDGVLKAFLL